MLVDQPARIVVYLWGLDALPTSDAMDASGLQALQDFYGASTLHMVQALAEQGENAPRLWCVTRNSQAVLESDAHHLDISQSAMWGFGRVIALERSDLWGGLIDLPEGSTAEADAHTLLVEVAQSDADDQIAFRDGQRYVSRLVPQQEIVTTNEPLPIRADATMRGLLRDERYARTFNTAMALALVASVAMILW